MTDKDEAAKEAQFQAGIAEVYAHQVAEKQAEKKALAVPQASHHVEIRDHTLRSLRAVLLQLDERRQELVEEDNVEDLAAGVQDLRTIIFDMEAIDRQARVDLAKMVDARDTQKRRGTIKKLEVEGVGLITSNGGWTRKGWESQRLLREILGKAIASVSPGERIVNEDGEVLDVAESQTMAAILDALETALPITGSLSWRSGEERKDGTVTGLKKLGFDDADYCTREEKVRLASVPEEDVMHDMHWGGCPTCGTYEDDHATWCERHPDHPNHQEKRP